MPHYPEAHVELAGQDGNAFFIIGRVLAALRAVGVDAAEIDQFVAEAASGDYDNVLRTVLEWVTVDDEDN